MHVGLMAHAVVLLGLVGGGERCTRQNDEEAIIKKKKQRRECKQVRIPLSTLLDQWTGWRVTPFSNIHGWVCSCCIAEAVCMKTRHSQLKLKQRLLVQVQAMRADNQPGLPGSLIVY